MLGATIVLPTAKCAWAQIIIGGVRGAKLQKLDDVLPELQKQLEEAFQRAGQAGARAGKAGQSSGGLRPEKPAADPQQPLGLGANQGAVVPTVDAGSVGARAGVMTIDVLVKIGDKSVSIDHSAFINLVKDQKENEPMDLVVVRKG